MTQHFDLIVLGTGPSASRIAKQCAESMNVAIIEKREIGGECALRGCNPKKVFVRAAELMDWVKRSDGKLIDAGTAALDWSQIVAFKNSFTDPIPQKSRASFESKGITVFQGEGHFVSPNELMVDDTLLSAEKFAICTGAQPVSLDIPGEELVTTSAEFMDLAELPESVVFIGGGYISFEFAHVAQRLGRKVTIIDRNNRPLQGFDPDLVHRLVEYSSSIGIDIVTIAQVTGVRRSQNAVLNIDVEKDGQPMSLVAGLVVHGAGRVPSVAGLNLDAAGVDYSAEGIAVNEFLQSPGNPAVFAAGDVVASAEPMLTPVANQQGFTVAKNILTNVEHRPDYGPIPKIVFTVPELATVGLSQQEAADAGYDVEVIHEDHSQAGSVRKVCCECAAYKLVIDRSTGIVLGANLLGPGAADMINLFAVAMKADMTHRELKSVLMAFPTFTSDIRSMLP